MRTSQHPLNALRRSVVARAVLGWLDVPVWVKLCGVKWRVRVHLISNATYFLVPGGPEPEIVALFGALMRVCEIQRFWDVGANVGYYGWLVASLNPTAEVCMLEPDERNVELLRSTKSQSGLGRVQIRAEAASEAVGRAMFHVDTVSRHKGTVLGSAQQDTVTKTRARSVMISTTTLDELRSESGRVDLIKIDVEGHEESVLRGAERTLREDQPILILECFHPDQPIVQALLANRYRIVDAECLGETSSETSNYLAIPERFLSRLPELAKARKSAAERLQVWGDI
jgi:FkbM family methyltransferase